MIKSMRQPTIDTIGLGSVLEIYKNGQPPVNRQELVDKVFGSGTNRGSLVLSGVNGIVGAGKAMQLSSRLQPLGVNIIGLDFPGTPDGLGKHYPGLHRNFGREKADRIMSNIVRLTYDGKHLPAELKDFKPRFLLEAIPEKLDLKKAHYELFRNAYPDIDIKSVTSGFPSSALGVGIAHPAFPHEINKVWEIVEEKPSPSTQLLWALGMIPMPVSDHWSFILDVLFCGITLAGLRYHESVNMPYWKIDKYIRKHFGPNPFRAHDAIGAKGASFLTWSCLHHLDKQYGSLFKPAPDLIERKDSGQNWYPMNHFRPVVNWALDEQQEDEFLTYIQGALFQMVSLMLHEERGHLSLMNSIGESCAQFQPGILAQMRRLGAGIISKRVKTYQENNPDIDDNNWYPQTMELIASQEWQQLYVNAEHDGDVGLISIGRESYNWDVDEELNRAIDWLKAEGIDRVIISGDFHVSTQMVGADTSEFFPALESTEMGINISKSWSQTARRLHNEFKISVGCITGKRCLGGFLELLSHCHYLVADENAKLGFPEVTLPVIPGMEGCHWPFRKTDSTHWPNLLNMLLNGQFVNAGEGQNWLVDFAGSQADILKTAWDLVTDKLPSIPQREFSTESIEIDMSNFNIPTTNHANEIARKAIIETIQHACSVPWSEALDIQARHSAEFMVSEACKRGSIGREFIKVMKV